jgi:hypothetical protein
VEVLLSKNKIVEIEKSVEVIKRELVRDIKVAYLEWVYTFK